MNNTAKYPINLREVSVRYYDAIIHATHPDVIAALSDIPPLVGEIARLRVDLEVIRYARANMIAAALATLHAARDGENDPLWYLRDELSAQARLSADAREAMQPW